MQPQAIGADAVISPCKNYRYLLTRDWGVNKKVGFIMLNPSTADYTNDDPTIRRCMSFAAALGYSGIEVCNLFAYRATDPKQLEKVEDPIGPENDDHLLQLIERVAFVITAWGNQPFAQERAKAVCAMLKERTPMHCLGTNKNGSPKHPLYLPKSAAPIPFQG